VRNNDLDSVFLALRDAAELLAARLKERCLLLPGSLSRIRELDRFPMITGLPNLIWENELVCSARASRP
jgi:hypothetical protein